MARRGRAAPAAASASGVTSARGRGDDRGSLRAVPPACDDLRRRVAGLARECRRDPRTGPHGGADTRSARHRHPASPHLHHGRRGHAPGVRDGRTGAVPGAWPAAARNAREVLGRIRVPSEEPGRTGATCAAHRARRHRTAPGPGAARPAERRKRAGGQHPRRDAHGTGDGRRGGGAARRLHQHRPAGRAVPRRRAQAVCHGLRRAAPRRAAVRPPRHPRGGDPAGRGGLLPRVLAPRPLPEHGPVVAAPHPGRGHRELAGRRPPARGEGARLRDAFDHGHPAARSRHHARRGRTRPPPPLGLLRRGRPAPRRGDRCTRRRGRGQRPALHTRADHCPGPATKPAAAAAPPRRPRRLPTATFRPSPGQGWAATGSM